MSTTPPPPPGDDIPPADAEEQATLGSPRKLKEERDRYYDQLLRAQADFANYQKRAKAQAESDREYYVGGLARDLLDVLDNFERSVAAARSRGADDIADGMALVARQMQEVLARHGVEPIDPAGQVFDPNFHEAVMRLPASAEHPAESVARVLAKGYRLKDRVLRPAKVAVATDH
ncbi:MAG: nucleotide exchange factor GrpE [Isosphaeraceae bacterium]